MKAIGAWVLSILAVAVIGAVIDLVLPGGRMNKFVKSIFGAVTVLLIVLPLPNLVKNGCSVSEFLPNGDIELQEDYLDYVANIKKKSIIAGLKDALNEDGITLGDVELEGDFSGSAPNISAVKINLSQVVIVGQSQHINMNELIRSKVSQYLAVDKGVIVFYEQ